MNLKSITSVSFADHHDLHATNRTGHIPKVIYRYCDAILANLKLTITAVDRAMIWINFASGMRRARAYISSVRSFVADLTLACAVSTFSRGLAVPP
jgi:hypothetical protein